jgi:hypothetical protein
VKTLQLNVILNGVRSKVDHSLSLNLSTPELTNDEAVEVMNLQGVNLDCTLSPLDEKDAPLYKVDKELNSKTPGQRLRAVIYIKWKRVMDSNQTAETFESYYGRVMETFIDKIKDSLE